MPTSDVIAPPATDAMVPEIITHAPVLGRTFSLVPMGDANAVTRMLLRASEALSEARTLQQVQQVHAAASAALSYIRQRRLGQHVEKQASAIKWEAKRALGGMLIEMAKAAGGRPYHALTGTLKVPVQTLRELGISKNESSRSQQLYQLPKETFRKIRDEGLSFVGALAAWRMERDLANSITEISRAREMRRANTDLRIADGVALLASGICPHLVITEPRIETLPTLAAVCVGVPFVVLRMHQRDLSAALSRVEPHLTRHGIETDSGSLLSPAAKVTLLFCTKRAIADFKERRGPRLPIPSFESWQERVVFELSREGDLVCDPFLNAKTARAAVGQNRRFVGASLDPAVVDQARRAIEVG